MMSRPQVRLDRIRLVRLPYTAAYIGQDQVRLPYKAAIGQDQVRLPYTAAYRTGSG